MKATLREFFVKHGYEEVEEQDFIFMKEYENEICLVHITGATRDCCGSMSEYINKRKQLEFYWENWSGKEVRILDLVVVTSTRGKQVLELVRSLDQVWILDEVNHKVLLFDEQKDFDGMYQDLEQWMVQKDEEDSLPLKQYIVTIGILCVNAIFFFLTFGSHDMERTTAILEFGVQDWKSIFFEHEYYRFFTCQFLHFGWKHFFNNMVVLLLAGSQLEPRVGSFRFFIMYIFSGFIGGVSSAYYSMIHQESVISAGASGAIYGILGALLVDMLRDKTRIREALFRCFVLVGGSLYLTLSDSGVDHIAHIGGFIGGVCLCSICTIRTMISNARQKRKM